MEMMSPGNGIRTICFEAFLLRLVDEMVNKLTQTKQGVRHVLASLLGGGTQAVSGGAAGTERGLEKHCQEGDVLYPLRDYLR